MCTLADLNYDVYHASVDLEGSDSTAALAFYIRPRFGDAVWDVHKAARIKWLVERSIQRRFPKVGVGVCKVGGW